MQSDGDVLVVCLYDSMELAKRVSQNVKTSLFSLFPILFNGNSLDTNGKKSLLLTVLRQLF